MTAILFRTQWVKYNIDNYFARYNLRQGHKTNCFRRSVYNVYVKYISYMIPAIYLNF